MLRVSGVTIRISVAEFVDRLSILHVKAEQVTEPAKRQYILSELAEFERLASTLPIEQLPLPALLEINRAMWRCNEHRKVKLRRGELDAEYLQLTIQESELNDERYRIKRAIDEQLGSEIREQKSYAWI